jgi:hypothetical protein
LEKVDVATLTRFMLLVQATFYPSENQYVSYLVLKSRSPPLDPRGMLTAKLLVQAIFYLSELQWISQPIKETLASAPLARSVIVSSYVACTSNIG